MEWVSPKSSNVSILAQQKHTDDELIIILGNLIESISFSSPAYKSKTNTWHRKKNLNNPNRKQPLSYAFNQVWMTTAI